MPRSRYALLAVVFLVSVACGSESTGPEEGGMAPELPETGEMTADLTDTQVFAMAMAQESWVWYKRSADTLTAAADSPHTDRLRTRYNTVAATQLDDQGKVMASVAFPDSSLIVKEVYRNGELAILAVMMRAVGHQYAGHGDWLWGEYAADGSVLHSIAQSQATCHNCHVRGLDHTRMNDAHP